jgi:hypothetical protein
VLIGIVSADIFDGEIKLAFIFVLLRLSELKGGVGYNHDLLF